jgi:phosphoglycolate phosphatase-like HAD superfamily hydrolase
MIPLPPEAGGAEAALAARHRPVLMIDRAEPFLPRALGFSLHRAPGSSPSSKFEIVPQGAVTVEYAVWYDWDIQHLYDLEHVWVHLDAAGGVIAVEASFHGTRVPMPARIDGGRPVLFAEPGKHAHWPDGTAMARASGDWLSRVCGPEAGTGGVHLGNPFGAAGTIAATARDHRLARRSLERRAFRPAFEFAPAPEPRLLPWPALAGWIPAQVNALVARLPREVPHLAAVLLDCGDTLIDEATERKIPGTEIVTEGAFIPGAEEAVRALHAAGWPLALVADGPRVTFETLLRPSGLWDLMQAHAISGDVGVLKPAPAMFRAGLSGLGLTEADAGRVVMVGNNLARDIRGARALGIATVHVAWSTRRSHVPAGPEERPDRRIDRLQDLPDAIADLERALPLTVVAEAADA